MSNTFDSHLEEFRTQLFESGAWNKVGVSPINEEPAEEVTETPEPVQEEKAESVDESSKEETELSYGDLCEAVSLLSEDAAAEFYTRVINFASDASQLNETTKGTELEDALLESFVQIFETAQDEGEPGEQNSEEEKEKEEKTASAEA